MKKNAGVIMKLLGCILFMAVLAGKPLTVRADSPYVQISLGRSHTAGLKKDGSLWMWGGNWYGQLGTGDTTSRKKPVKIMTDVASVSLGNDHSAALKKDGSLWIWGGNAEGELGNGGNTGSGEYLTKPVKIMTDVASVSLGANHSAAIKKDGSLWIWGSNDCGQLGTGGATGNGAKSSKPVKIMTDVTSVSLGIYDSAAIKKDGSLWMWGANFYGELGVENSREKPVKVMTGVSSVSLGAGCSAVIKKDGSLWMCGRNYFGQLGTGDRKDHNKPVKIMENVKAVSLGGFGNYFGEGEIYEPHAAALKKDGSLWTWGVNQFGQLGTGSTSTYSTKKTKVLTGVASVELGGLHSGAVKKDGSLWMWGSNGSGELGTGDTKNRSVPVKISGAVIVNVKKCTIKLSLNSVAYTGSKIKPAVTVKNGSVTMKQGTDYTLSYSNNKNLGMASVTIKGKGSYTGTVKKTFQIVLAVPKLVSAQAEASNSVKVTWNKVTGAKTYKLYYKEAGAANWTGVKTNLAGTTYTHTSNKLQAGKQYIYTVRAVNGEHTSGFDKNGVSVTIPESSAKLSMTGIVTNSATGKGLAGVTLNFRRGFNKKTGSAYAKASSGANGNYSVELEEGQYTVQLSKAGYVTTYTNIECKKASSGTAARVDLTISARLATGQYRIVLSWGAVPEDLDAHLTGPLSDGKRFHIFYQNPDAVDNGKQVAKVDVDDKTSYGPETVTINLDAGVSGIYRYYIHDYSDKHLTSSSGLANSGARVTVYKGDKQVAAYSVPQKAGTKWHVFNINNGNLVKVNEMTYEKSPGNFQ